MAQLVDMNGIPVTDEIEVQSGPIDALDAMIMSAGSWSSKISVKDRVLLRKITKKIHMKNYPNELLTDYEADRIIAAMGPETGEYLIRKHMNKETYRDVLR